MIALALAAESTFGAAASYRIVTLETLPSGVDSFATGINELGVPVGHSTLDRTGNVGRSRPVVWDASGQPTELWPLEDALTPGAIPEGINDAGQIVGRYGVGSGVPLPGPGIRAGRAFIWDSANGRQDLGSLGGDRINATGINAAGQVVGSSSHANSTEEAFVWDAVNGMAGLGTLGGIASYGEAINDSGRITGTSFLSDFSEQAFLWDAVGGMKNLGSSSGFESRGKAISNKTLVVGTDFGGMSAPGGMILWSAGTSSLVMGPSGGTTPFAFDVNSQGEVVGTVGFFGQSGLDAFIWDPLRGFINLEDLLLTILEWDLESVAAINENGQIVGHGRLGDQVRGFLLTPVPEPFFSGTTCLLGALAGLRVRAAKSCLRNKQKPR